MCLSIKKGERKFANLHDADRIKIKKSPNRYKSKRSIPVCIAIEKTCGGFISLLVFCYDPMFHQFLCGY